VIRLRTLAACVALTLFACPAFAGDDGKQKQRKAYIQKAISLGIIKKIDQPATLPHMWVTPIWQEMDFDDKANIAGVVFGYYYIDSDGRIDLVRIRDSKTGKDIGTYAKDHGLSEKESSDKDALYYRSEGYIDGYAAGLEDGKKETMEEWKARYNSPDYKSDFDRFCGENPIEGTEPVQEVSTLNTSFTEMAERTRIISIIEKKKISHMDDAEYPHADCTAVTRHNAAIDDILEELRTETTMQNVEEQIGNAVKRLGER